MRLQIEWRHPELDGKTGVRCYETGKMLDEVVADIAQELSCSGIEIDFVETIIPEVETVQTNLILFNGVSLEEVLTDVRVSQNCCESCSRIIEKDEYCRTVEDESVVYEEIPRSLIYRAAIRAVGVQH